jgi:hypothetical protein
MAVGGMSRPTGLKSCRAFDHLVGVTTDRVHGPSILRIESSIAALVSAARPSVA